MKAILSEKNLVVILFIMVLITFSLAQEDSKKVEKMFTGIQNSVSNQIVEAKWQSNHPAIQQPTPAAQAYN